MTLEGRWTVFVCTGCGGCTGRHAACDARREKVPVVPVDDAAVERVARALSAGLRPTAIEYETARDVLRAAGETP